MTWDLELVQSKKGEPKKKKKKKKESLENQREKKGWL